jgi:putative transcriptional regulator
MTPKHHPSDATLLTYAAGSLGEGLSLVVASHLAFCDECRAAVAAGEPEALAASARDRTLALLDAPVAAAPVVPLPLPLDPALPAPLGRYLKRDLGAIPWRVLSPGLKHFEVLPHDLVGGANLRLLRIAPGHRLPRHGHAGTELTLVLTGSYSDELGRFVHEPVSDRDEDCICLIAIEGRLKFEGRIARLFQRFSGM